jgi:protein-disulfide isomerase
MNKNALLGVGGVVVGCLVGYGIARSPLAGGVGTTKAEAPAGCDTNLHASLEGPVIAVGNQSVAGAELPENVRAELYELTSQNYLRARELLEGYATRFALAKEKGGMVNPAKVPDLGELLADKKVSEDDVRKFYETNKKSFPPNMTFESISKNLRIHLETQRNQDGIRKTMAQLRDKKAYQLLLPSPCGPRVAMDFAKFPTRGDTNAKETLVAVGDFFCASCRYFKSDLENFLDKHRDTIRYTQVITTEDVNAPVAQLAAGAYCAKRQSNDAFWKYSERAYNTPYYLLQKNAGVDEVRNQAVKLATEAGLDTKSFEKCMTSGDGMDELTTVTKNLKASGADKTPTYIASGRRIVTPNNPAVLIDILTQSFPGSIKPATDSSASAKDKAPTAK